MNEPRHEQPFTGDSPEALSRPEGTPLEGQEETPDPDIDAKQALQRLRARVENLENQGAGVGIGAEPSAVVTAMAERVQDPAAQIAIHETSLRKDGDLARLENTLRELMRLNLGKK